ncbi:hypothetical protein [Modestobacter sp. DSM 44400]|uniref:hypothetical protein n=1 Tax=Modestobacter sp. DSM 44400 TaxID=1550230 RepID=UPI000B809A69|nr:hypothetical protein [Modestobacter sp. DSM 44400]
MPWLAWVLIGWTALAVVVAVPLGLAIREADRRERGRGQHGASPADSQPLASRPVRCRVPARRRIPMPPIAVALAGVGVALETAGFLIRASGAERGAARLFSMDLPMSVPRLYVAALFVAAAGAAFLGATRAGSRRGWWIAVGVVAASVAQVKAGGTVHVLALATLGVSGRPVIAAAGSALVAGAVLASLWWVSRDERRDRRRVLVAFGLYAGAAVGLSGISSLVGQATGASAWTAAATFVEESGEALAGVTVLIAVLVGVAPRLVLPAQWSLRRTADAETVDAPGSLPTWSPGSGFLH